MKFVTEEYNKNFAKKAGRFLKVLLNVQNQLMIGWLFLFSRTEVSVNCLTPLSLFDFLSTPVF